MTVSSTEPIIKYAYTGPKDYTFPFRVFVETDLDVVYTDANGITQTLIYSTDYTVTLVVGVDGGTVTTTAPTDIDGSLTIQRDLPITQEVDWVNNDPLDAEILETSFDRIVMVLQEMEVYVTEGQSTSNWKGTWATATQYYVNDLIEGPDSNIYMAMVTHISGTWATDLADGDWGLVIDLAAIEALAVRAETAATNAETAETNAETAEANAATSETQAGLSEANSGTSAQEAANCADDANDSAVLSGTYKNTSIQYGIGENPLGTPNEPPEGSAKYWAGQAATQAGDKVAQTAVDGSAVIPAGTVAQRDGSPINGYFRYNSEDKTFEGYVDGNWVPLSLAPSDNMYYPNKITADLDYNIPTDHNAMSAGPITLAAGVTVTIPAGSTYTVV